MRGYGGGHIGVEIMHQVCQRGIVLYFGQNIRESLVERIIA
jgi:hypothetical protein